MYDHGDGGRDHGRGGRDHGRGGRDHGRGGHDHDSHLCYEHECQTLKGW